MRAHTRPSPAPGPRAPGRSPLPFPLLWEAAAGGGGRPLPFPPGAAARCAETRPPPPAPTPVPGAARVSPVTSPQSDPKCESAAARSTPPRRGRERPGEGRGRSGRGPARPPLPPLSLPPGAGRVCRGRTPPAAPQSAPAHRARRGRGLSSEAAAPAGRSAGGGGGGAGRGGGGPAGEAAGRASRAAHRPVLLGRKAPPRPRPEPRGRCSPCWSGLVIARGPRLSLQRRAASAAEGCWSLISRNYWQLKNHHSFSKEKKKNSKASPGHCRKMWKWEEKNRCACIWKRTLLRVLVSNLPVLHINKFV